MKHPREDPLLIREKERKKEALLKVLTLKNEGYETGRRVRTRAGSIGYIQRIIEDEAMVMVKMRSGRSQIFNPDNLTLLPKVDESS